MSTPQYATHQYLAWLFDSMSDSYERIADQAALDGVLSPIIQTYQVNKIIFRQAAALLRGEQPKTEMTG